jgi:hypothetical protein
MRLIGRRDFTGALGLGAGAHLLGAVSGRLAPEALGAEGGRKRFILFTHGGGLLEEHYSCPSSPAGFELNPVMAPLAPFKKDLLVISKLYCPHDRFLHGNGWATTTMVPKMAGSTDGIWGKPPGGISFDRLLAGEIGKGDPFSSTVQAIAENGTSLFPAISADGPGKAFPPIQSPVKAYATYFGQGLPGMPAGPSGPPPEKALAQHRSVLDALRGDITRMSGRLAGAERAKLDQYLESLRGLERQLGQVVTGPAACATRPAEPPASLDKMSLNPDVIAAHVDVMFHAQACGLTRVSHFTLHGNSSPHNFYGWLGDQRGFHNDHHAGDKPMIAKISNWVFTKVAQLAERMAAAREGNGTMLDNSLVAFINVCGGKHHGGQDTYSVITLGQAGGALKTGRVLNYPVRERSLADAYVGFAHALGAPIRTFGDPAHNKGPLPGLL